jgi:hypothetical protein
MDVKQRLEKVHSTIESKTYVVQKDKGLKFRSYMIRVESMKKNKNKAKGHAGARRGVGDTKRRTNKEVKKRNKSTCKVWHKNPFPSDDPPC